MRWRRCWQAGCCGEETERKSKKKDWNRNLLQEVDDYDKFMKEEIPFHGMAPSRIIWDISTIGYMINPHWCPSALVEAPYLTDDVRWKAGEKRHSIRVCNFVYRDGIFGDMFEKLGRAPK